MRRHPARSLEMAVMHLARPLRFGIDIQVEYNPGDFTPVGTLVISVKYP